MAAPARGTQLLVGHIGSCVRRPGLVAIEILWTWAFGVPLLMVGLKRAAQIRAAVEASPNAPLPVDFSNPWNAACQIEDLWQAYAPRIAALAHWLLPAAVVGWIVLSALGRSLLLSRMIPGARFRPVSFLVLQAAQLGLFALVMMAWFHSVAWAGATHIPAVGEPDLVSYAGWVIFFSLGFFILWALASWPLSVAPVVMLEENISSFAAIARSFRLGKPFTAKLVEVSLVMGIVRLALLVLAMVFSSAPLPFSDELGPDALRAVWMGAVVFYLIASDLFQVVRLRSTVAFWEMFQG